MKKIFLFVTTKVLIWNLACAQDVDIQGGFWEEKKYSFSINVDNDLFLPKKLRTDLDYTMGLNIKISASDTNSIYSLHFGSSNFTPDSIEFPEPIFDDRPYSSLIYIAFEKKSKIKKKFALGFKLTTGILGTRVAEWGQTKLHTYWRQITGNKTPYDPGGWPNQICDGGKFTFRFTNSGQFLLVDHKGDENIQDFDFQLTYDANIGYYINASSGFMLRYGKFKSPWWTFSTNPVDDTPILGPISEIYQSPNVLEPSPNPLNWFGYYIWFGARVRPQLFNAHLQGLCSDDIVRFKRSEIKPYFFENEFGITLTLFSNKLIMSYVRKYRSSEFEREEVKYPTGFRDDIYDLLYLKNITARPHAWGGIYITLNF